MKRPLDRPAGVTLEMPEASSAQQMDEQSVAAERPTDPARQRIEALPFDAALAELQSVVGRLETGNLPLEESIELYEQGVLLHERCARLLGEAELRLQRLVDGPGGRLRALDLSLGEAEEQ